MNSLSVLLVATLPASIGTEQAVRAQEVCEYDAHEDEWVCDKNSLERFFVENIEATTDFGEEVPLIGVEPMVRKDIENQCIGALKVSLENKGAQFTINWASSSMIVNGDAVQALPGFARGVTSALAQKPSVVPSGARFAETIHPMESECILPPQPDGSIDTIEIRLNVRKNEVEENKKIVWGRRWVGVSEKEAMSMIEKPMEPVKPKDYLEEEERHFGLVFLATGTGIGALIGIGVATAVGVAAGFNSASSSTPITRIQNGILAGIVSGLFIVPPPTAIGLGIGLVIDLANNSSYEKRENASKKFRIEQKKAKAYEKKIREYGKVESPTSG